MHDSSESINLDDSKNEIIFQVTPLKNPENNDETVLDAQIAIPKLSWIAVLCDCFRISNIFTVKSKLPCLLPPQSPEHQDKNTLVLDLDETLVHSSFQPISCHITLKVTIDQKSTTVYVVKRPGLDKFIEKVAELFEVVVFTASLEGYAKPLLEILDPNHKIAASLYRDSCTLSQSGYVKDLSRLGRALNKTLIIDNSPHSYSLHKSNAIPIKTWTEDPHDTELTTLLTVLEKLATVNNIPKVLTEVKKRSLDMTATSLQNVINNDSVLTRGYYNSPVHLKSKRFQFEDN